MAKRVPGAPKVFKRWAEAIAQNLVAALLQSLILSGLVSAITVAITRDPLTIAAIVLISFMIFVVIFVGVSVVKALSLRPELKFLAPGIEFVRLDMSDCYVKPGNWMALVAAVRNSSAVASAKAVRAHIEFRDKHNGNWGLCQRANSGTWIDERMNTINIPPNGVRELIIAVTLDYPTASDWRVPDNPREKGKQPKRTRVLELRTLGLDGQPLPLIFKVKVLLAHAKGRSTFDYGVYINGDKSSIDPLGSSLILPFKRLMRMWHTLRCGSRSSWKALLRLRH